MTTILLMLALVLILWGRETWIHHRALRAIPIRIHVNGSRGKSSVTRLLAAALREGGFTTVAKVTGSKPRLILPDGEDEPIVRVGSPNICEQIGVLDRARRAGAQAMVMECMAVRPDLQRICEEHIMHSTIGVVTNIRPDHLDVMGPTVEDVAVALSATIPRKAHAVLGDARYAVTYRKISESRGSTLHVAAPDEVSPEAMDGFTYVEHEENVATCLAVTRILGVADDVALRGMYKAIPDVGACTRWHFEQSGRRLEFINIFAANDLESTITIWQKLKLGPGERETTFALINLRADRIDRSLQYAEAIEIGIRADYYVLIGGFPDTVLRKFEKQAGRERLIALGQISPHEVFDQIARLGSGPARVGGVGNIGGLGHKILEYVVGGGYS